MGMRAGGKVKGERLMVRQAHQPGKGKRNKFNLSLFSLTRFPIPCLSNIIFTGATRDHKY